MPQFSYKALSPGGGVYDGRIAAENRESAIASLRAKGVVPLKIDMQASGAGFSLGRLFARRRRATVKDLMLFTRELCILLSAKVPLARALSTLDRMVQDGPMQGLAGRLLEDIRGGASLEQAMQKHPEIFPPFYLGMIKAGEAGGSLEAMLERLGTMLERNEALNSSVRSALVYPILVLVVTGLSLVVLMVFVIPEFRPIFEDAGEDLPVTTRAIMAASDLVIHHGWLILVGLLAAVLAVQRASLSKAGRLRLHRWLLSVPRLGDVARKIETARFCRSLGTLRANGVTLIEGISIAAGTLTNEAIAEAARETIGPLSRGEGLSGPMERSGTFPTLATQLIAVGEESGKLETMLLQVADVYDAEAAHSIQRLLALLSPIITIGLGLLIALIIGSILSAILGSYDLAV